MCLAAGPVARMAFMKMRFVRHVEAFRRESFAQLVCDNAFGVHGGGNTCFGCLSSMSSRERRVSQCQDLKPEALRSQREHANRFIQILRFHSHQACQGEREAPGAGRERSSGLRMGWVQEQGRASRAE